jgi:hypothetical protein
MKKEYWDVSDEQVHEKTGESIDHWVKILSDFNTQDKKSNDSVTHLQNNHGVPRYWARTMTTLFLKSA